MTATLTTLVSFDGDDGSAPNGAIRSPTSNGDFLARPNRAVRTVSALCSRSPRLPMVTQPRRPS